MNLFFKFVISLAHGLIIWQGAPILYSWVAANFAGHTKKTMVNALIMMSFCLGNALGPLSFTTPPVYWGAKVTMLATLGFAILVLGMLVVSYRLENNKRARRLGPSGDYDDGFSSFMDLTDGENKAFVVSWRSEQHITRRIMPLIEATVHTLMLVLPMVFLFATL